MVTTLAGRPTAASTISSRKARPTCVDLRITTPPTEQIRIYEYQCREPDNTLPTQMETGQCYIVDGM